MSAGLSKDLRKIWVPVENNTLHGVSQGSFQAPTSSCDHWRRTYMPATAIFYWHLPWSPADLLRTEYHNSALPCHVKKKPLLRLV